MLSAKEQRLTTAERERLIALITDGLTYTAAAKAFATETGKTVSISAVTKCARKCGVRRNVPKMTGPVREVMVEGFNRQRNTRAIVRDVFLRTGVTISRNAIRHHRREWEQGVGMSAATECDLCGVLDAGERFRGGAWRIDGLICNQCRADLMAETQRRRQDREIASRAKRYAARPRTEPTDFDRFLSWKPTPNDPQHGVYVGRAKVERAETLLLISGTDPRLPIACCHECQRRGYHFTGDDLRGRAVTHWLKATLATDATALLMAG